MLKKGYLASNLCYVSTVHTKEVIDKFLENIKELFKVIKVCEDGSKDINEFVKEMFEGEISKPTMQVNKTKDITLGFIKLKKEFKLKNNVNLVFFCFVNIWLKLFYFR